MRNQLQQLAVNVPWQGSKDLPVRTQLSIDGCGDFCPNNNFRPCSPNSGGQELFESPKLPCRRSIQPCCLFWGSSLDLPFTEAYQSAAAGLLRNAHGRLLEQVPRLLLKSV